VNFARKESEKWLIGFHFHNNSPSRIRAMKPIFVWPRIWASSKETLKTIKNMFGTRNLFAKNVESTFFDDARQIFIFCLTPEKTPLFQENQCNYIRFDYLNP
jgi:hypothetical protein